MAATYSISELAGEFQLTSRAIRFYEDMGLLQPQRTGAGGRSRAYTPQERTRLKLARRAKRLGLSLVEAKEIIDCGDKARDTAAQLRRFLVVPADHRVQRQMPLVDPRASLAQIRVHEKKPGPCSARLTKLTMPTTMQARARRRLRRQAKQ